MSVSFNVGGVPEHFNLPWQLALQNGSFEEKGITINWKSYPAGTGAMCNDLRNASLDVAVLLTEGIVADIAKGNPSRIVQVYVKSPLMWGIHVSASSAIHETSQLKGKRYAISRFGSGSHLMAFVDAQQRGWKLSEDQFVLVNTIDGAREALKNGKADVFMWEKFMTKPLVDSGEFRRVDVRNTPWPCFVIAVRNEILEKFPQEIKNMQEVINKSCLDFMRNRAAIALVSSGYNLSMDDAHEWFSATEWATSPELPVDGLSLAANTLKDLNLIETSPAFSI